MAAVGWIIIAYQILEFEQHEFIDQLHDFPYTDLIHYSGTIYGFLLLFCAILGVVTSIKRVSLYHWIFAGGTIIIGVYLFILGLVLSSMALKTKADMSDLCSHGKFNTDFIRAIHGVYSHANKFWWLNVCPWDFKGLDLSYKEGYVSGYVDTVQTWNFYYSVSYVDEYKGYVITFNTDDDVKRYLDKWGKFEDRYSCSGIWEVNPIYYFVNNYISYPSRSCKDAIDEKWIDDHILPAGLIFLASGILSLAVAVMQFFLCDNRRWKRYEYHQNVESIDNEKDYNGE